MCHLICYTPLLRTGFCEYNLLILVFSFLGNNSYHAKLTRSGSVTDILKRFDPSLFLGIVPIGEFSKINPWKGTESCGLLLLAAAIVIFIVARLEYLLVKVSLA